MAHTSKPTGLLNSDNVMKEVYNGVDKSITTNGFLVGKIGHKVTRALATTSVPNDTEVISFYDGANLLYTITIVYTDATLESMISAERTA